VFSSRQLDTRESLACIHQTVLQLGVVSLRVRLAKPHVIEILPRNQRSRFIANCQPCLRKGGLVDIIRRTWIAQTL
jgi:hypothetical protein